MPHHHLLVTGQAQVEFQGIGPELQSGFEALQGIFARLMRGTPMPDQEEIAPWGLRVPRQARLATGQAQRGPQRERDRHAHVSPAFRCSHHRLPTHPLTRVVALDDVLRRARRAPSPGVVCPTSAQAPRASALAHPWPACTNAASGERADAGRESTNHATLRLTRRAPTRGPQHHLTMPHRRCPPGWVLLFCRT
jgi:hypothetical protein